MFYLEKATIMREEDKQSVDYYPHENVYLQDVTCHDIHLLLLN
jgi:hypothetical protein